MKPAPEMPADLDHQAAKKWAELIESCAPDIDIELAAIYCRSFSNLLMVRREKKRLQKKGKFSVTVAGRDGTQTLHPVLVAENRLLASLTRASKSLGLATSREESPANRRSPPAPPPRGLSGPEPPWGWQIEAALCGDGEPPIREPGPSATDEEWQRYDIAKRQQGTRRKD